MDNLLERLEKMNAVSEYIKEKMKIYIRALNEIAQADDQANPIALRNKARIALVHEPTTADKFNKDIVHGPNDPGDEQVDKVKRTELDKWKKDRLVRFGGDTGTDADFKKEVDIINEQAEAEYRNTVLHPEYKSEYSEEE